jgi:hypothetical protein
LIHIFEPVNLRPLTLVLTLGGALPKLLELLEVHALGWHCSKSQQGQQCRGQNAFAHGLTFFVIVLTSLPQRDNKNIQRSPYFAHDFSHVYYKI